MDVSLASDGEKRSRNNGFVGAPLGASTFLDGKEVVQVAQVQDKPGYPVTEQPSPDRGNSGALASDGSTDRQVQPKPGYPVTETPPGVDAGSDSEYVNRARGHVFDEKARALPSKKVRDGVRKDGGSPPGY